MERRGVEEERRAKERQLMEEGRSDPVMSPHLLYLPGSFWVPHVITRTQSALFRAMWKQKKSEEAEMLFRDIEDVKEFSRKKMFGK